MEERKIILKRVYLVYILCGVFALAIIARVFFLQFAQGKKWELEAKNFTEKEFDIEAVRGNIFAVDGSLLATSLPYYDVGIDPHANAFIDDAEFDDSAQALAKGLSNMFPEISSADYYHLLINARSAGLRYQQVAKNISHKQLQEISALPLFRSGRFKGGFIYMQHNQRKRLFGSLAERTIGYVHGDSGQFKVGLEDAYDSVLTGISGKRLMRKIAGGVWMPINNENEIEPQQGKDILTTINVNIQDVAENALMNSLAAHDAKYGCVVLMEVSTGEIRAIANLSRQDSGVYVEDYNYAIADAREPGSTFKLASLLVAMDDGRVDLTDKVDLEGGHHAYTSKDVMNDSHTPKENSVTVADAFYESSNVGISKTIYAAYGRDPKKFTDGLHRLKFGMKLGLPIKGEGESFIKNAGENDWSGISLPWISIGYESLITPLQTLTLYNAVANNGVMVKPMFVKEIREKGKTIRTFTPEIINDSVAKPETIKKAKQLLEGVVQFGTARNLKNSAYPIAGKTGTAQIAKGSGYGKDKNNVTYQASFVGYFPADKPKYSCIVIVNAPSGDVYYGGVVAGPIFKQIADRVYETDLDLHSAVNSLADNANEIPQIMNGLNVQTMNAANILQIDLKNDAGTDEFAKTNVNNNFITLSSSDAELRLSEGWMPDLIGMAGADALYLLEKRGYRVRLNGAGAVHSQSVSPGQKITKDKEIIIDLSI